MCWKHYRLVRKYGSTDERPKRTAKPKMEKKKKPSLLEKLKQKSSFIEKTGCIEYTGGRYPAGYGRIRVDGRTSDYTHRVAYRLSKGEIPNGMFVCHKCDNPSCINPEHLYLGTPLMNMQDRDAKGRGKWFIGEANPSAKLTDADVVYIRTTNKISRIIAKEIGVSTSTVAGARIGRSWSHVKVNSG